MGIERFSGNRVLGFTLLELLVTVAVLSILSAIAIPGFSNWMVDLRLKSTARELVSNFQKCKIEAVKRNANVVLSFSPQTYAPKGGAGRYVIFVDNGAGGGTAGNFVRESGETLILQVVMPGNVSLYSATFSGNTTATGFNSRGLPASGRIGNVKLRDNRSGYYKVCLSMVGNIALKTSNDGVTWN